MKTLILMMFITCAFSACSQNNGPGYLFDLFKNTASWKLAKAVQRKDQKEIEQILNEKKIDLNFQEPRFGKTILHFAFGNC
jgi:hypothetical protein